MSFAATRSTLLLWQFSARVLEQSTALGGESDLHDVFRHRCDDVLRALQRKCQIGHRFLLQLLAARLGRTIVSDGGGHHEGVSGAGGLLDGVTHLLRGLGSLDAHTDGWFDRDRCGHERYVRTRSRAASAMA